MHPLQKKILDATAGKDWVTIKLREFGRQLSEEHPQMIKYHLYKLEESGYIQIKRNPDLSFDIKNLNRPGEITSAGGGWMTIPVLGAANCGQAATYADHADEGYLRVSDKLVKPKKGLFAIRAIGDSMNRADVEGRTIEDGDYVIIDSTYRRPKNNDYVLSIIGDVANIKRFYFDKTNDQVVLLSESSKELPPIYIHPEYDSHYLVNGKVISVLKRPK